MGRDLPDADACWKLDGELTLSAKKRRSQGKSNPATVVAANRLLAALMSDDFALLSPHLRDVPYEQGTLLQETGDPIEQVYFPQSGMISLLAVMLTGNAVETATIGREGAVGAMAGLGSRTAINRAVAHVAEISSRIKASLFREALNESPRLRDLIIRYNDVQMSLINQAAGCNAARRSLS